MVKLHKKIFGEKCIFARRFRFLAFSGREKDGIPHGFQGTFQAAARAFCKKRRTVRPPVYHLKNGDMLCFLTQYTKSIRMFCENFRF